MDHSFFYRIEPHELPRLRNTATERVCMLLVSLFVQFEGHTYLDDETLTSAGTAVAEADHLGVDDAVLDWFAASPTDRRLAEVGAFLDGYWTSTRIAPSQLQLDRLIAAARHFTPRDAGWRFATNTLLHAYRRRNLPEHTRRHLRDTLLELRDALAVAGEHAPLLAQLTRHLA